MSSKHKQMVLPECVYVLVSFVPDDVSATRDKLRTSVMIIRRAASFVIS